MWHRRIWIVKSDEHYMRLALKQAEKAAAIGEVPIGCIIVCGDKIVGRGYNKRNNNKTTLAHAELIAIDKASRKLGDWRLEGCTMYVTLEPCQMCSGALVQSRIDRVVVGTMNAKAGCAGSILNILQMPQFNHQVELTTGVLQEECQAVLQNFFKALRQRVKQEKGEPCTERAASEKKESEKEPVVELKKPEMAGPLFAWCEDIAVKTCLEGAMGQIYADREENPTSAAAILGDFCFLAGEPKAAVALCPPKVSKRKCMVFVPQNEEWAKQIEAVYGEKASRITRFATKKEGDVFDREQLQEVVNTLPEGYSLTMMTEELFYLCQKRKWCRDWVAQYEDYAQYEKYGIGAVICKGGEPIAGASSYCGYSKGIEIEIITREDYRRRGLAYICGAKLILECLKKGWYPSWDAKHRGSLALSEKLGYHFKEEYTAYDIFI